jgi:DNA polymerase type B, organellar and viral
MNVEKDKKKVRRRRALRLEITQPIIFTHTANTVDFLYSKEWQSFVLKQSCSSIKTSEVKEQDALEIVPFFLQLLTEPLKGSHRKNNIFLFTFYLEQLYNTLISVNAFENFALEKKTHVFQGRMYVLKISEKKPAMHQTPTRSFKRYRRRTLVIKNLENFGISEPEYIMEKNHPEAFLNMLKVIKNELNVEVNNGSRLSASSVAEQIFKKCFPSSYNRISSLSHEADDFIRKGYIGGRNEVYTPIVDGPSYYYDINSLYPFIMQTKALPIGKPVKREASYFTESRGFRLEKFFGYLEVSVEAPSHTSTPPSEGELFRRNVPILPFKFNRGNENIPYYDVKESKLIIPNFSNLIYPVGVFSGVYFSEELKYAVSHGYKIISFKGGYEFSKLAVVFDGFVKLIYEKRRGAATVIENLFWKEILNTLFGRYGLKMTQIVKLFDEEKINRDSREDKDYDITKDTICIDPLSDSVLPSTAYEREIRKSVAISAAITSYARIYMHNILVTNNITPLYWDTDGLFISHPMPMHLVSQTKELGKFRLMSQNSFAVFISGKFYYYKPVNSDNYIYTFRGIPHPFRIKNPDDLRRRFIQALTAVSYPFTLRSLKGEVISTVPSLEVGGGNVQSFKTKDVVNNPFKFAISVTHDNQREQTYSFEFHNNRFMYFNASGELLTTPWEILAKEMLVDMSKNNRK